MEWARGDAWELFYAKGHDLVIPTNAGWTKDGRNVTGAGLAKQACEHIANRFNEFDLAALYGGLCRTGADRVYLKPLGLILVPSKPLRRDKPSLSWKRHADMGTVRQSLEWLVRYQGMFSKRVGVPLLGAGNGRLDPVMVKKVIELYLGPHSRFIGIEGK